MLRSRYPAAQHPVVDGSRLTWTVELRPTPLSVPYTVRLQYRHGDRPVVTVLDPPLQRRNGEPLPHVFGEEELCLDFDDFDDSKHLIAEVLVPWVSDWLYYYEAWVTTGEWHGGGIHPEDLAPLSRATRRRAQRAGRRGRRQHPSADR